MYWDGSTFSQIPRVRKQTDSSPSYFWPSFGMVDVGSDVPIEEKGFRFGVTEATENHT